MVTAITLAPFLKVVLHFLQDAIRIKSPVGVNTNGGCVINGSPPK